jgi:hypothetical protein
MTSSADSASGSEGIIFPVPEKLLSVLFQNSGLKPLSAPPLGSRLCPALPIENTEELLFSGKGQKRFSSFQTIQ